MAQINLRNDETPLESNPNSCTNLQGYLDLEDILYPQTNSKQNPLKHQRTSPYQQGVDQNSNRLKIVRFRTQSIDKLIEFVESRRSIHQEQVNPNRNESRQEQRHKQSTKHNFPKHLVRKVKDLMKNILKLKKRERLESINSLEHLYFYLFHQNLKKNQKLEVFQLFLEKQSQQNQANLVKYLKRQISKYGIEKEIAGQQIQFLKHYLRKTLVQSKILLLQLVENGSINRKQQFKSYVLEFLDGLKLAL